MSSPAPVGRFLICNAAITEPPHLVSGWPEISDRVGVAPGASRPAGPDGIEDVVGAADLVRGGRELEQTPGLIDPDVADDVGRVRAGIGVAVPPSVALRGSDRLKTEVRSHTAGSSRPMVPDTPLPNSAVYWMLLTPVSVFWPPSRIELMLPGKPCHGDA